MAAKEEHSPLGKELIAGMQEAVAYARGEIELPTRVVEVSPAERTCLCGQGGEL